MGGRVGQEPLAGLPVEWVAGACEDRVVGLPPGWVGGACEGSVEGLPGWVGGACEGTVEGLPLGRADVAPGEGFPG
jgi:hypothetical protein